MTIAADRVNDEYRGYTLLSAFHQGKFRGRAWRDKKLVFELEGTGIDDVLKQLRNLTDQEYTKRIIPAEDLSNVPTVAVSIYVEAFRKIHERINDSQRAMLRANFRAPDRRISPSDLAVAAGFKSVGGVNIWYGFLGQWLFEAMTVPLVLQINDKGEPVYTSALASYIPVPTNTDNSGVWKMHDAVAMAVAALGLAA